MMAVSPSPITIPENIAVTGRILSWLKDPNSRLPVSCTVYVVEDSMEDANGIENSWLFASKALRNAAGVAIHLSKLRAKGTTNQHGLVASGPVSFAQIYSKINEILRRGGAYRNGAITLHLDYDHPDALEFIEAPRDLLPWAKKCLNVDDDFINYPHMDSVITALKSGDLWLAKKSYDTDGNRIYHNVCLEVQIYSRGTCLLSHVNLGGCKVEDIPAAFESGMKFLCDLHGKTGVETSGIYLTQEEDRQVGLGVLGLASFLAREEVTYKEFTETLEKVLNIELDNATVENKAYKLVEAIVAGFNAAARVAKENKMARGFVVAPTATCSYKYTDSEGFTTTPEIAPPIDRKVDRDSETLGVESYSYNPKVEIAAEVGWDIFFRLNDAWQRLMDRTGVSHAMSTNWWSDMVEMDTAFIQRWLESSLKSLYYSLQVMPTTQDKSSVYIDLSDELSTSDFSILGLTPEDYEQGLEEESCSLAAKEIDNGFCSACAE